MTCKNCVHKCYTEDLADVEEICNFFIDKSKYIEVVRCEDCEIGNPDPVFDGFYYCHNNKLTHRGDHYCGYGYRINDEKNHDAV